MIAVKVDNSQQPNSRSYSGSGIYRNVWLTELNPVHIAHWGTFITTPEVSEKSATVVVKTKVNNRSNSTARVDLTTIIQHTDGREVTRLTDKGVASEVSQTLQVVLSREVRTAEAAAKIVLTPDRQAIKADGTDLSFVTVKVIDKNGTLVPSADNLVQFELIGPGEIVGVDNGNQISHESFKANQRKAFHGMALAIVQSKRRPGRIVLKARSDGLESASVVINAL